MVGLLGGKMVRSGGGFVWSSSSPWGAMSLVSYGYNRRTSGTLRCDPLPWCCLVLPRLCRFPASYGSLGALRRFCVRVCPQAVALGLSLLSLRGHVSVARSGIGGSPTVCTVFWGVDRFVVPLPGAFCAYPLSLVRLRDPVECTLLSESRDLSLVSGYLN